MKTKKKRKRKWKGKKKEKRGGKLRSERKNKKKEERRDHIYFCSMYVCRFRRGKAAAAKRKWGREREGRRKNEWERERKIEGCRTQRHSRAAAPTGLLFLSSGTSTLAGGVGVCVCMYVVLVCMI